MMLNLVSKKEKLLIILILFFALLIFSCSKKEKLQANTLQLYVSPSYVQLQPGGSIELTCRGKSAKSDDVDINPEWEVNPKTLGTVKPTRGKKVNFQAGNQTGSGKIKVQEGDVYMEVNIFVGSLIIYWDKGLNINVEPNFYYFDTDNVSPWQISTTDYSPGCDVDSQMCIKVSYTDIINGWAGFYLKFTTPQDLSSYTKLTFWVRGENGNEKFKVGIKDSYENEYKVGTTATASWQKITCDLTHFIGVNKNSISLPFILAFENNYQSEDKTIYIDLIQYE